jgi:hypothetical protein
MPSNTKQELMLPRFLTEGDALNPNKESLMGNNNLLSSNLITSAPLSTLTTPSLGSLLNTASQPQLLSRQQMLAQEQQQQLLAAQEKQREVIKAQQDQIEALKAQLQQREMNQQQPPTMVDRNAMARTSPLSEGGGSGASGGATSSYIVGRIPANKHDNRKLFVGGLPNEGVFICFDL